MKNKIFSSSQDAQFEVLIEGLLQNEVGHHEHFLSAELVVELRNQLLNHFKAGEMHPAGVGNKFAYQKNAEVRGDVIKWVETETVIKAEKDFLKIIQEFVDYLNKTCYTGINDFEFHYALYDVGSFYKPHIDQFKSDSGRKYSVVVYLNEDWTDEDGGEFVATLPDSQVKILPRGGTVCFFASDKVMHEVKVANRKRLSIAGWLKKV